MDTLDVILDRAADLIQERGWTQEKYQNNKGGLCIVGAINTAAGNPVHSSQGIIDISWFENFIARDKFTGNAQIAVNYNDHVAKDKRQIIRLLHRAAKAYREMNNSN